MIRDGARLHPSLPVGDQRHPNAAFVQVPLAAPQRAVAVEELQVVPLPAFGEVSAVVAGEQHQGVAQFAQVLQLAQQVPHLPVQQGDLGRMHPLDLRPAAARVQFLVPDGALEGMRCPIGHEQEEGTVPIHSIEEINCQVGVQRILAIVLPIVVGNVFLVSVHPYAAGGKFPPTEAGSPLLLGGVVEAVPPSPGFQVVWMIQVPFADIGHLIAGALEHFTQGEGVFVQGNAFPFVVAEIAGVAAHGDAGRAFAREQHSPGGCASGVAGVEVGELHAHARQLVQFRGFDDLLPVGTQFPIAQIIGHQKENVRPLRRLRLNALAGHDQHRAQKEFPLHDHCRQQRRIQHFLEALEVSGEINET